jgi:hypothetical protein
MLNKSSPIMQSNVKPKVIIHIDEFYFKNKIGAMRM